MALLLAVPGLGRAHPAAALREPAPPPPPAAPPPASSGAADSSLHRFLESLADSTDRYFGLVAAPLDTAGLDSALAAGLARPPRAGRGRTRLMPAPRVGFNRVDGTLWGAGAGIGNRRERWRVAGDLGYAAGTDRWLGGGEATAGLRRGEVVWRLRLRAGRRTVPMDRDHPEPRMAMLRALVAGSDRQNYLRRSGFSIAAAGEGVAWRAGLAYHEHRESPLAVTTRWNLARRPIEAPENLAAAPGRARELAVHLGWRWPRLPLTTEVVHHLSAPVLASDFDYRRTHAAVAGEIPLLGHLSLVPQLAYGRLVGDMVPQAAFYLGGAQTLRSLPGVSLGGSGLALARLDLLAVDDLLALARIPHPAMLPLQGGLFAASGTVWGADPNGGPGSAPGPWPERFAWRSEAGLSLLYRPGVPDEQAYLRLNLAWPLGPGPSDPRWSLSYGRPLDLLRPH